MLPYLDYDLDEKRIRYIHAKDKYEEEAIKHRCSMIDSWALKIFIGLDIQAMGTYFYCVYAYVFG